MKKVLLQIQLQGTVQAALTSCKVCAYAHAHTGAAAAQNIASVWYALAMSVIEKGMSIADTK